MRIARLELLAYGPFRGLELDFSAKGLHLVFGRNEAGKSTTLRAIAALLYGVETKTRDAHLHKPADLRIGGVLVPESGASVRVVRRKGNVNTLLDDRGRPLDDAVLARMLRGVSEETFRHAFGLDHETLERGAEALLQGKGDLGESLFDASLGGGGEVQRLLAELLAQADAIYRPRATSLPLNEALRAHGDAQKLVRERQSLPEAYVKQEQALEQAQTMRASVAQRRSALAARRSTIERARRRIPLERKRVALEAALSGLKKVTAAKALVFALQPRIGAYERTSREAQACALELERLKDRAAVAARHAGIVKGSDPGALRFDSRKEARIQRLLADRELLAKTVDGLRIDIARLERNLERARTSHVSAPDDPEGAVARALERARAMGDAEVRHAADVQRTSKRRAELAERARAIGLFEGSLDRLVLLRVPPVASVERLATRSHALDRSEARLDDRASALDAEAQALSRQILELRGDAAPPDASTLRAARQARDAAWALVQSTKDRATAEEAFERAVRDADDVADRMILEADRVTLLARAGKTQSAVAAQRAEIEEERAKLREARARLEMEHRDLFAPAGIDPRGFEEMRAWLERHAQIVEQHARLRDGELEVEAAEGAIGRARTELACALGEGARERTLDELVFEATRRLEAAEAARDAAEERARTMASLEAQLEERSSALLQATHALDEAKKQIADLVRALDVAEDCSADEVVRGLEALRDFFALEDRIADVELRARAATDEARGFEEDVARMARSLAPDLASASSSGGADAGAADAGAADAGGRSAVGGRSQSAPPTGDALSAREAAAALLERAQRAQKIEHELEDVTSQLAEMGGLVVPQEIAELVGDPERLQAVVETVDQSLAEAERELSRLDQSIGGMEVGLVQMRSDSHAVDAAELAQEALSRLRSHVERYARAKLAAVVLAREIDRYREENQGPLLAAASTLFSRLTLAAFSGIRAGFDERDRPALRCVRASGAEVDVTGLSEGTRDQLYLSLRLASLLRYAEASEAMPLVLDDVLVQFDDERARAALVVLADVALRMQVLFFTHHARLVEIARDALPSSVLHVHELGGASPPIEVSVAP